jgi:hypothetical protein
LKLQVGIKVLDEIVGHGEPIKDSDRFDAVLKFYRNKGDPLEFATVLQDPIPFIAKQDGKPVIAWSTSQTSSSSVAGCLLGRRTFFPESTIPSWG